MGVARGVVVNGQSLAQPGDGGAVVLRAPTRRQADCQGGERGRQWPSRAARARRFNHCTRGDHAMANEGYHEPVEELSEETKDMHRAIVSLMEELEAVDWYNQRVDACKDPDLRDILAHNRDEEKEHAAMLLEWVRRQDGVFDKELKDYLFTDKPITHHS